MKKKVFSAMRPTGKLHLGHLVGALHNWIELQKEYDCIFSVADWHALMSEYENSKGITDSSIEMAIDWIASGIDPEKSTIFIQSQVPEHLELQMIFSCLTPLGWLERNPTYKEQLREIGKRNLQTYGFLGYPVLQAADILLYKADAVPIGEDQLPHLELTREIARKFNHTFKVDFFTDCEAILTESPRLLGLDGRKMSKSFNNTINLSDTKKEIAKKTSSMITDPKRIKLTDKGHPDECNVFSYYNVFCKERTHEVRDWCENAKQGCSFCKKELAAIIDKQVEPIRSLRSELEEDKPRIKEILFEGCKKAKRLAEKNINLIKESIF